MDEGRAGFEPSALATKAAPRLSPPRDSVDKPGEEPGRSGWGRHGCWWGALVAHGTDHKCSVSITSAQAPRDFIFILNVLPRRLLLIIAL